MDRPGALSNRRPRAIPGRDAEPSPRAFSKDPRIAHSRAPAVTRPSAPPASPPTIDLCGVPLHALTLAGAADHIIAALNAGRGGWVVTPNLDILRRLVKDRGFADLCARATLRLADGMPLVWASRLQRTPLPERVAGSDLIWTLTARAAAAGRSVYFLGGNPGAADGAARELRRRHPGLRIAGVESPPLGFESCGPYMDGLRRRLAAASPDIVYVALGSPKQERVIDILRADLPRAWFLGIGISFSFVTGEVRRAPRLMRRLGLEWAHRLAQEPRRLAKRYLVDGLPFAAVLIARAAARAGRSTRTA